MYSPPLTVTSFSTVVTIVVIHISFGASASHSLQSVAVAESASSVISSSEVASSVVAPWVVSSCCIPSVAAVALVVASMDSTFCLLSVVSGVVLPLVVQHPLALSYGFLWGSRPSCFVLLR